MVKANRALVVKVLLIQVVSLVGLFFLTSGWSLTTRPPSSVMLSLLGGAALLHLYAELWGYRTRPAPRVPADSRDETVRAQAAAFTPYVTAQVRRFVAVQALAVLSLATALIVTPGTFLTAALGVALASVLLGFHLYPWSRPVERTARSMSRFDVDGAERLREMVGLEPAPVAPTHRA